MPELSIVIIAFNEEKNIGRCLDSVNEVADDIVVVDSFSTDQTANICREKGARIVQHKFDGHIEQKNWAITQAKYPHILSLDADEALDERLKKAILDAKANWKFDGYAMNRLTNYCGHWIRHCGWYPDTKLRLWDSRKGKWVGENPHDKFELFKESKLQHLPGNILHYSYYTREDHFRQIEYFTNISSKAAFGRGKRATPIKLIFSPIFKFINSYLLQLGFLDGGAGFNICRYSSYATFLKYKKLKALEKNHANVQKIIISRTDSIGDVILTLPVAGILKRLYPASRIVFLGNEYTRPVLESCENVDEIIDWKAVCNLKERERKEYIRKINAGIIIHVFPRKGIAGIAKKAGINLRIGTTNRIYHWTSCNKLVRLSRRKSPCHEAQLNLKLISPLGANDLYSLDEIPAYYGLTRIKPLKDELRKLLAGDKFNLILHPKSRGNSKEWGTENFSELINILPEERFRIFITGTRDEGLLIQESLVRKYPRVIDLTGRMELPDLISFIHEADGLIAASTGPLHIASALGKYVIGLYPSQKPIYARRWAPLGKHAYFLEEDKSIHAREGILQITPETVKDKLIQIIGNSHGIKNNQIQPVNS